MTCRIPASLPSQLQSKWGAAAGLGRARAGGRGSGLCPTAGKTWMEGHGEIWIESSADSKHTILSPEVPNGIFGQHIPSPQGVHSLKVYLDPFLQAESLLTGKLGYFCPETRQVLNFAAEDTWEINTFIPSILQVK